MENRAKILKINGRELKEPEEMTYWMAWNFKDIFDSRKKRKAEKEIAEDLFRKSLAAELRELLFVKN